MRSRFLGAGVILVLLGGFVFIFNYDRETITVSPRVNERVLLDYYAPTIDPFPHHIVVEVDTNETIEIIQTLDNETTTIYMEDGSTKFTVYPGETIRVVLRNPDGASGEVKTVFYCDSWNYSAIALASLGALFFIHGIRKAERSVEGL